MIETIYRFTCTRCGKKFSSQSEYNLGVKRVRFEVRENVNEIPRGIKYGDVCKECEKDFRELAESFFDDLNMERDDEQTDDEQTDDAKPGSRMMKQRAVYISFSSHDCESWYRCPCCHKTFGGWSVFRQEKNENGTNKYCPHCKEELDGLE